MDIPVQNIQRLTLRVEKLNRKAQRLGLEELSLKVGNTFTKDLGENGLPKLIEYAPVELSGKTPKIKGWEFIAKLEITDSGCIVSSIKPDVDIPKEILENPAQCQHCNSIRYRKDTFVLRQEGGEFKAVGRQCLKDFLGLHGSTTSILESVNFILTLEGLLSEPEFADIDPRSPGYFRLGATAFLKFCVASSRLYGYKNRKMVEDDAFGTLTTGDTAWIAYFDKTDKSRKMILKEDEEKADAIITWIDSLSGENQYELNLKTLLTDGVSYNSRGIMASAVMAYERSKCDNRLDRLVNEHFGEIGKRSEMHLTYLGESRFDTDFGIMSIMRFRTDCNHLAVWKTTSGWNKDIDVGCSVNVKATVKDHTDYKGFKQTLLSRVTLI